jgi:hypothetical protein
MPWTDKKRPEEGQRCVLVEAVDLREGYNPIPAGATGRVMHVGDDGSLDVLMDEYHMALGHLANILTSWTPYTDEIIKWEMIPNGVRRFG